MKFPSIKIITEQAGAVLKRFPFEMLFAFTGTAAAICLTELSRTATLAEAWCVRVIMIANLGLLLSMAVTLYTESRQIKGAGNLVFKLIAALAAAGLLFMINPYLNKADYTRFFLFSFGLHLLVAFAAFLKPGHIQGFWQFNKTLFLRFLTSVLYSAALYAGIAAALGAMNFLFNFKFEWDTFMILWICIAGIFNTFFFLAGVPADFAGLDEDHSYPKSLKIFTQYVLIPLATLYVVILLAYEIKIIIQWNLPKGLVSNLILGYAVFGMLALLLVYPISHQEENKWIKTYARSFYFLLLPLIVLLFVAVGTRIFSYGITEFRYFLILLACWALFIAIYFLVSKRQNIKLIPITLCICTLLSIYGPQSAFSVSRYSQKSILIKILRRNGLFKDEQMIPLGKRSLSKKEGEQAVDKLEYLVNNYDLKIFQPYVKKDLDQVSDSLSKLKSKYQPGAIDNYTLKRKKLLWIADYMELNAFVDFRYDEKDTAANEETKDYYISAGNNPVVDVTGYELILNSNGYTTENRVFSTKGIRVKDNKSLTNPSITLNDEKISFDLKTIMGNVLKDEAKLKLYSTKDENNGNPQYIFPAGMLSETKKSAHFTVTLRVDEIRLRKNKKGEVLEINSTDILYLIRKN